MANQRIESSIWRIRCRAFAAPLSVLSAVEAGGMAVGQTTLYANSLASPSRLYRVESLLSTPNAVEIGSMGVNSIADIACDRLTGVLFAVNDSGLYSVNPSTGAAFLIGSHGLQNGASSLEVGPDGTLYLAHFSLTSLYRVNRTTGQATPLFDTGRQFRGDLAHDPVTGDLFGLVISGSGTALVRMNLQTQTTAQVGSPFAGVFTGLEITQSGDIIAASGASPNVVRLDRVTAAPTPLGTLAGPFGAGLALAEPVCANCTADYNCSGQVSVQDIFDMLTGHFAGDLRADINHSGAISVQDIFDFLALYFAGCP